MVQLGLAATAPLAGVWQSWLLHLVTCKVWHVHASAASMQATGWWARGGWQLLAQGSMLFCPWGSRCTRLQPSNLFGRSCPTCLQLAMTCVWTEGCKGWVGAPLPWADSAPYLLHPPPPPQPPLLAPCKWVIPSLDEARQVPRN